MSENFVWEKRIVEEAYIIGGGDLMSRFKPKETDIFKVAEEELKFLHREKSLYPITLLLLDKELPLRIKMKDLLVIIEGKEYEYQIPMTEYASQEARERYEFRNIAVKGAFNITGQEILIKANFPRRTSA